MGIIIAIPIVALGSSDLLTLPESLQFGGWLGLIFVALIALVLYRSAVNQ